MIRHDIKAGAAFREACIPMSSYTEYRTNFTDGTRDPYVDRWHVGPFNWHPDNSDGDSEPDGEGEMLIRVAEVVKTERCGTIVIYHREFIDPEGEIISRRRKITSLGALRGYLAAHKMEAVEAAEHRAEMAREGL